MLRRTINLRSHTSLSRCRAGYTVVEADRCRQWRLPGAGFHVQRAYL